MDGGSYTERVRRGVKEEGKEGVVKDRRVGGADVCELGSGGRGGG